MNKTELRSIVEKNIDLVVGEVNLALSGKTVAKYEKTLTRVGRNGDAPHWYQQLKDSHSLPNLDGKTIGSVIEMLIVAVLENSVLKEAGVPPLRINPARGVDLPDLDLGIKSPSENFCTSEPFYSAYERLIGSEYDAIVLLTDYQTAKSKPPLKLQIIKWKYLKSHEIADINLCAVARTHREWLLGTNEAWAQKLFRFLAYVNQSDWRAKHLLRIASALNNSDEIIKKIEFAKLDFEAKNKILSSKDLPPIAVSELEKIVAITSIDPIHLGVLDAVDNWVVETQKDFGRMPNENELNRLKGSPLDGKIGMSFALQWRYNFGRIFGATEEKNAIAASEDEIITV